MTAPVLEIIDLWAEAPEKQILKGVDLTIKGGEIHAVMGPNGNGKSTLAAVLMGNPSYTVTQGNVLLDGQDVLAMSVDERARAGIFLGMQYPSEVSGVTNSQFLRTALNARRATDNPIGFGLFNRMLRDAAGQLEIGDDLPHRYLNEGFSGGEKKRNEILQMMLLQPRIAILDEIDSGLDIDALRIVGEALNDQRHKRGDQMGLLMITHYQRMLSYVQPDFVHVLADGKIVHSGGADLALQLEQDGYEWLKEAQ